MTSLLSVVGVYDDHELSFVDPPSQRDNVEIYFGRELCFVINSSLVGSLTPFYWACKSKVWIHVKMELCSDM